MTDSSEIAIGVCRGDVLVGKYRVDRVLGSGGMGVVIAAHHLQLDEPVALKLLLPSAMRDPQIVARFEREARAAVKIKSEHVARVSDVGVLESGAPYMVMEYLEGRDLSAWLVQDGRLPIELAVDFILQACEALAEAHSLGIVHRDVKPANLFCIRRADGQLCIKVLDFGISRFISADASRHELTRTSSLLGTPLYMSPEHMRSARRVDERSDIWALGVILYELLSGATPFDADAVTEVAIKVATMPAPWLSDVRVEAPAGLALVIAKCLEKEPERRFQTVGDLATALAPFAPAHARLSVDRAVAVLRRGTRAPDTTTSGSEAFSAPALSSTSPDHPTELDPRGLTHPSDPSRPILKGAVGLVALLVLAGVARVVLHAVTPPTRAVLGDAAFLTASPSAASAARVPAPIPPTPSPSASSTGETAVPSLPPSAAPSVPTPHAPHAPRSPSTNPHAASALPPSAPPECDPPFTIDAKGTHVFKRECL